MIEAGSYVAVATDTALGETKNGKPQIAVLFQIVEGEHRGECLTWYGYFTAKTADRTLESLRLCGWKGDDVSSIGELPYKVQIVVIHDPYDGKTTAKINWVNKLGGGEIMLNAPMSDSAAAQFAAQMKSRASKAKEVEGEVYNAGATSDTAPTDPDAWEDSRADGDDSLPWEDE